MLHLEILALFTQLKASGKVVDLLNGLVQMAIRFMQLLKAKVSSEAVRPNLFLSLLGGQEPVPALKALWRLGILLELNQQRRALGRASP